MDAPLLIKNALAVLPHGTEPADVLVVNGVIRQVGASLSAPGAEVIDATGLTLIPGAIDPQVHFREPGMEWKEDLGSGSRAAAAGGVTGFLEMPNTSPPTVTAELMDAKKKLAASKCLVNYNFFVGATPNNVEEVLGVKNVCGIKIFMGASTGSLLVDRLEDLDRIFSQGRRLIAVHAEDEALIRENKARYA